MQQELEIGRGDCVRACIASLLDLSSDAVPNFRLANDPWLALQNWLAERGLFALKVRPDSVTAPAPLGAYCIAVGQSRRSENCYHAVIARAALTGLELAHDPHPDGTYLDGDPVWLVFLVKLFR